MRSAVAVRLSWLLLTLAVLALPGPAQGDERTLDLFDRRELTDVYYSEGANAGDIDGDGHVDVICGPYWFAGPEFAAKHEIYPAKPQNRDFYADNFFSWPYDVDGDGRLDVFTVGFPGKPAYVYRNPGPGGYAQPWERFEVFDSVSNESPHFVDLIGDGQPELVCTRDGFFGYASIDPDRPLGPWSFRAISEQIAPKQFGHGLGVGDVNGDGRLDVIFQHGWLEHPADRAAAGGRWPLHSYTFAPRGGAEMYAYDVDGDGDNDVITSLEAHEFGLAWFEQVPADEGTTFVRHLIMGSVPAENRYGLVFSEPHSVALADIDGDGLKDIVTGKTYWSHHRQSPMWDTGAVAYWFRLERNGSQVEWVPQLASADPGIGRQVSLVDVNGDQLLDVVLGGMKGCNVLLHRRERVDDAAWRAAQPQPYEAVGEQSKRGEPAVLDEATGRAAGAIEGEALRVLEATSGEAKSQDMKGFRGARWSGDEQLFWTGGKPEARLRLELPAVEAGAYDIAAALTMAGDYAVVRLAIDDERLGEPIDLFYHWDVVTTGVLELGQRELAARPHTLTLEIVGANRAANKKYFVGLDFIRLTPARGRKDAP